MHHRPAYGAARLLRVMVLAAAMAATAIPAGGTEIRALERDRNFVLRHGTVVDLQTFDTRERRRAFQDEQSRFREVDRVPPAGQARRLKVPRMQRNCQLQL